MMRILATVFGLTCFGLGCASAGAAGGWAGGPDDPPRDLLAGPDVGEPSLERTLVERGVDGQVRTLAAPPAILALELLELDEKTRESIDGLLTQRAALMDTLVLSNIELLGEVETVMAVGAPVEKLNLLREGLTALGPVRTWGRLDRRIAAVLPASQRAPYRGHLAEYERERYDSAKAAGEIDNRFAYKMTRYWEDLAWEIERAAERVFAEDEDGDKWLRTLTEKLGLSSDQEGEIRAMAERFYIEAKGRPTEQDEMRFVSQIRGVLTLEQKWKFTGMLLRGELDPKHQTDGDDEDG
jgi:hypothetical protein